MPRIKKNLYLIKKDVSVDDLLKYEKVEEHGIDYEEIKIISEDEQSKEWIYEFKYQSGQDERHLYPEDADVGLSEIVKYPVITIIERVIDGETHMFAICDGDCRSFINIEYFVGDFGLRTLFSIDGGMKQFATKNIVNSNQSLEQKAFSTKVTAFKNIDKNSDAAKFVSKEVDFLGIKQTISARNYFAYSSNSKIGEMDDELIEIINKYKEDLPHDVSFLFNKELLRDSSKIDELNQLIADKMNARGKLIVSWPELLDPESAVTGYSLGGFGRKNPKRANTNVLDQETLYDLLDQATNEEGDLFDVSTNDLSKMYIRTISGGVETRVPLMKCLVFEKEETGDFYNLYEGNWYKVNNDFYDRINAEYSQLAISAMALPNWDMTIEGSEAKYNENTLEKDNGFINLDKKFKVIGARDKIEIADSYKDEVFITVKKSKSSSGVSHLATQARATIEYLRSGPTIILEGTTTAIPFSPTDIKIVVALAADNVYGTSPMSHTPFLGRLAMVALKDSYESDSNVTLEFARIALV